jgi:hypothetical protein
MELPTFLRALLAFVCSYNADPTAGVMVVAPEAGGEKNEREEGSASELGVKSVVEGEGGGEGEGRAATRWPTRVEAGCPSPSLAGAQLRASAAGPHCWPSPP